MDRLRIITKERLFKVLKRVFKDKEIGEENIDQLSDYILNFFGFQDSIIDNILTPPDRDVFYMLEELGILKTDMDEVTLIKGKSWRIHYWSFRKDRILEYLKASPKKEPESLEALYKRVFSDEGHRLGARASINQDESK